MSLYLDISDSFKDGSSKLSNHSAMAVFKVYSCAFGSTKISFHFKAVFPVVLHEADRKLNDKN